MKNKRITVPLSVAVSSILEAQYHLYNNGNLDESLRYIIPMFLSVQGGGKTSTIEKVAKKYNLGIFKMVICHIPLSEMTGAEVPAKTLEYEYKDPNGDGSKDIVKTKEKFDMQYIQPVWMDTLIKKATELQKEGRSMYLFLDEFVASDPEAKKIALALLLERQVRGTKLPDNILMVAAGNYDDNLPDPAFYDRLFVVTLDRTLRDNFPICPYLKQEAIDIVEASYYRRYHDRDKSATEVQVQPIEFNRIGIEGDDPKVLRDFVESIADDIIARYNTLSPQKLVVDDRQGGVVNMTASKRKTQACVELLFTMFDIDGLSPFNIRVICDNFGFSGVEENSIPFYDRFIGEIKLINKSNNASFDLVKDFIDFVKDQDDERQMFADMTNDDFVKYVNMLSACLNAIEDDDQRLTSELRSKIKDNIDSFKIALTINDDYEAMTNTDSCNDGYRNTVKLSKANKDIVEKLISKKQKMKTK